MVEGLSTMMEDLPIIHENLPMIKCNNNCIYIIYSKYFNYIFKLKWD